jgi:dTDP-4-dehydrorhamnose 3,5-epimerase-like enzyme
MTFLETKISGVFEIRPELVHDERGFFGRSWCQKEFACAPGVELPAGAVQHFRQPAKRDVARHALSGGTLCGDKANPLHTWLDL